MNWTEFDNGPRCLKTGKETARVSRWKGLHPLTASVVFHGTSWHFHVVTCFLCLAGSLPRMPWETELFWLWKAGAELVFLGIAWAPAGFLTSVSLPASCCPLPSVKMFPCCISNVLTIHELFSGSFFLSLWNNVFSDCVFLAYFPLLTNSHSYPSPMGSCIWPWSLCPSRLQN